MGLCRGEFKCTKCGRLAMELTQDPETKALDAYCYECRPQPWPGARQNVVLYTKASLDIEKRLIKKLIIHKLDQDSYDRRGFVVSACFEPGLKDYGWHLRSAVELFQYCYMLVGHHYTIHALGETGEQADCWIDYDFHKLGPRVYLNHKYWGQKQIDAFIDVLLVLARIHEWEVEDERMSLLERIAKTAQDD